MLGRPGTLINCIERYLRIIASGKMKIESVDFFYLSIPEVLDIGDGSQDVLLVRLQAGYHVGWGECEAALLVSTASLVCPMSHSACKPIQDSVLGQRLDGTGDIVRIGNLVRENSSLDLLQTDHMLSGIDIACGTCSDIGCRPRSINCLGISTRIPKRLTSQFFSVIHRNRP